MDRGSLHIGRNANNRQVARFVLEQVRQRIAGIIIVIIVVVITISLLARLCSGPWRSSILAGRLAVAAICSWRSNLAGIPGRGRANLGFPRRSGALAVSYCTV